MTDAVDRHLESPEERGWYEDGSSTMEVSELDVSRDPLLYVLLVVSLANLAALLWVLAR